MGPSGRSRVLATGGLAWPTPATAGRRPTPGLWVPGLPTHKMGLLSGGPPRRQGLARLGFGLGLGLSCEGLLVLGPGMWNVGSSCTETSVSTPYCHLLPLPPVPGSSALLSGSPFLW